MTGNTLPGYSAGGIGLDERESLYVLAGDEHAAEGEIRLSSFTFVRGRSLRAPFPALLSAKHRYYFLLVVSGATSVATAKAGRDILCDFPHKLERFVKQILATRFDQERLYRLLA